MAADGSVGVGRGKLHATAVSNTIASSDISFTTDRARQILENPADGGCADPVADFN